MILFCAVLENMVSKGLCACVKKWITCWSWSVLLATDSNSTVLHFDSLNKPDLSWACGPVAVQSLTQSLAIAQLVECPLRGRGGHGFDPGLRHTKVIKNGTRCSSLGTQTYGVELGLVDQCQDNVTGCGIMSSVWDMILQWGSTIEVSTELPVSTRHRRDMTEKLLKATLNPNTHTHNPCLRFSGIPFSDYLHAIMLYVSLEISTHTQRVSQ